MKIKNFFATMTLFLFGFACHTNVSSIDQDQIPAIPEVVTVAKELCFPEFPGQGLQIHGLRLSWQQTDRATGYKLYRSEVNDFSLAEPVVEINMLTYDDMGLAVNTGYYYWLEAINNHGSSPPASFNKLPRPIS